MKSFFSVLLLLLGLISNSFAQDLLLFPENMVAPRADLPLDICMRESSDLMSKISNKDIKQVAKLRTYGYQLLNLGKHEYAKEVFEKALEINNNVYGKQDVRYVQSLMDLAQSYIFLIRYVEAVGMYDEALNTLKNTSGEQSIEYLTALNEMGIAYSRIYDWNKALVFYKNNLEALEKAGKNKGIHQAVALNNIGAAYKSLYDFPTAIQHYSKALELAKTNPRISLSIAANLAEALAYAGKTQEAKTLLEKYKKEIPNIIKNKDLGSGRVWTQYGVAYIALKDFDAAETCFQNAFVANSLIVNTVNSIPNQAEDLMFKNSCIATCGQAGIMIYSIEMYKQEYEATGNLQVLKDGYKVVQAFIKYGESLMNSYLSEENKLILFRLGATLLFDRSIYFAYELYDKTKDKKYIEDALFYSERSKSTLLVNALRSRENRSLVNLPDAMLQKERGYLANLKNLQKKQIEAVAEVDKNKIQQDINDLNIELERFKEDLQKNYPDYYQHRYNLTLTKLKTIQDFLAKKDNALIEYALSTENNYAFVVTKNSLEMVKLSFALDAMKLHTTNMRKTLTDYRFITKNPESADSLFTESSLFFYNAFIKPLLKNVKKGQHLLIIPDQNLGHLPFETFLTARPQKALDFSNYPYLLKEYPISYSYSATVLLGQAQSQQKREIPKDGVLAFAAEYPEISNNSFSHQRGGDLGVVREGLQPLPGAKKEVELMSKYLLGEFYHGTVASEETFKKTAQNYGIIHLAMHGVLDPKNPILSSLVFSEDSSDVEDNFLRAYEIAQMDLNAELVVLSACETGYGHFQQGEGVMSLAHSFSYAGASSILMSLWQVNDYSTSQIMKNYYVNMAKGWTKEKALREAKLTYLKDCDNKAALHPAFWAAFVQTGNVEPLELFAKSGKSFTEIRMMVLGGVGVLLLAILYVVVRRMRRNRMA